MIDPYSSMDGYGFDKPKNKTGHKWVYNRTIINSYKDETNSLFTYIVSDSANISL